MCDFRHLDEERRQSLVKERQKVIEEEFRLRADGQRQQIQEALNRQTYHQFRAYAEQQFPGNPEQVCMQIVIVASFNSHQGQSMTHFANALYAQFININFTYFTASVMVSGFSFSIILPYSS